MRVYLPLAALLLASNFGNAASPVLPIELISRNANGQQTSNGTGGLSGISSHGTKVAYAISDRAFFGEPPPPPPMPVGTTDIPRYGQTVLWQRGSAPLPLIDFQDGFGATNFPDGYYPDKRVKLSEESDRTCFPVDDGDLITGIRRRGDERVFCSAKPGPPYQYLSSPAGTLVGFAGGGVYGNEEFDLYGGVFLADPNDETGGDMWLHDRQTAIVERVSLANDGHVAIGSDFVNVSSNGRWVMFQSGDNSLTEGDTGASFGWNGVKGNDFFIRDRVSRSTRRLLRPDGTELLGQLNRFSDFSVNGRFLVFSTTGDVVAPCLTNFNGMPSQGLNSEPTFVHDFQTNTTECITIAQDGTAFGNVYADEINRVSISGDGRFVAYATRYPADATDINGQTDIYLRDRKLNRTIWVSQSINGAPGNARSISPLISEDGRWLAFQSYASNLVPNDTNLPPNGDPFFEGGDIFLRDLSGLIAEPVQVPAGSNWAWALFVLGLLGFGMRARAFGS